jgi:hypothetical protein
MAFNSVFKGLTKHTENKLRLASPPFNAKQWGSYKELYSLDKPERHVRQYCEHSSLFYILQQI